MKSVLIRRNGFPPANFRISFLGLFVVI